MKRSRTSGITLLEVIMVVVLMMVVLGTLVIRMGGLADQHRTETAVGDLRALQSAINAYYLNNSNAYPAGSDWQNDDLVNDTPRILRQVLYDPFRTGSTEYSYSASSSGTYYVVFSYGPDRTVDITGINDSGELTGTSDDDIFRTNGTGTFA